MYGCESWTIKKAECQRIDALKLWCWRRLLRVPWTARKWNHSILKEINPEYSLEGLMLKRKLWYFGHLMWRVDSLEKTLVLGRLSAWGEGRGQRMRWLDGIETQWTWACSNSGRQWRTGKLVVLQSTGSQSQTWLSDWTRKDTGQRCPRVIFSRSCVQTHKRNILIIFLKEHWAAYSFVAHLDRISSSPSAI